MVETQFDNNTPPTVTTLSGAAEDFSIFGAGVNDTVHHIINWRRDSTGKAVNLDLTASSKNAALSLDCAYWGTALAEG
jgi:hypothetical protein